MKITGETSDGYHTFNELYEHRHALFLNVMKNVPYPAKAWISKKHNDGTSFKGWFVAGIRFSENKNSEITYHLPIRLWRRASRYGVIMDRAPEFDGHTSKDVVKRLMNEV